MPKYQKLPVVIEAVQYAEYGKLVKGMCNSMSCYQSGNDKPHVHTIHDSQVVNLEVGDFVIPEPDGKHFYPVKPEIFEATYKLFVPRKCVKCGADVMPEDEWKKCLNCGKFMPTTEPSDSLDDQA